MQNPDLIAQTLRQFVQGETLTQQQSHDVFEQIMLGHVEPAQMAGILTALTMRTPGPTVDELAGAAQAMREHVIEVPVPDGMRVVDTCGTGGDHCGSFNISTAAAIIAAGAGVHVAKHGNRSVTSNSGSSQVLEALGVKLDVTPQTQARCLEDARICFCFAPQHHPAMRHAVPVRKALGFRTIFNLLGPLTNPAGARRQIMGVYDPALTDTMAKVLHQLGADRVMVVHGNGMDEITTLGETQIASLERGQVTQQTITPDALGLAAAQADELKVNDPQHSAEVIRSILSGKQGPARDIAAVNAAAAIVVADLAEDLAEGLAKAHAAIDDAHAQAALDTLVKITNTA